MRIDGSSPHRRHHEVVHRDGRAPTGRRRRDRPRRHRRAMASRGHPERCRHHDSPAPQPHQRVLQLLGRSDGPGPVHGRQPDATVRPARRRADRCRARAAVRTWNVVLVLEHQLPPARHDRRGGDGQPVRVGVDRPASSSRSGSTTPATRRSPEIAGPHAHGYIFLEHRAARRHRRGTRRRSAPRERSCPTPTTSPASTRRCCTASCSRPPVGVDDDDRPGRHRRHAGRRNPRRRMGTRPAQGRVPVWRGLGPRLRELPAT